MTTSAVSQVKSFYEEKGLHVNTVMCGDFNAVPRSGIYEFMRLGYFDCLKIQRNIITGQEFATFNSLEKRYSS
jgi:endonuclease/exonuclease/phosphatase family metal-dependent hydrolase